MTLIQTLAGRSASRRDGGDPLRLCEARKREALGGFISTVLLCLFAYIFTVGLTARLGLTDSTYTTLPMAFVWVGLVARMALKSGLPLAAYGLTRRGWVKQALIGVGVALALAGGLLAYKGALIQWVDGYQGLRLFDLSASTGLSSLHLTLWILAYVLVIGPGEELVRGGMQGSMQVLFTGHNPKPRAILLSNLGYSAIHVHLSLEIAALVFPVGLVWGWLFARSGSIIGPVVSHTLLGALAFFVVGVP